MNKKIDNHDYVLDKMFFEFRDLKWNFPGEFENIYVFLGLLNKGLLNEKEVLYLVESVERSLGFLSVFREVDPELKPVYLKIFGEKYIDHITEKKVLEYKKGEIVIKNTLLMSTITIGFISAIANAIIYFFIKKELVNWLTIISILGMVMPYLMKKIFTKRREPERYFSGGTKHNYNFSDKR